MNILQPLHDIARDQRIKLESINLDIAKVNKLIEQTPLQSCRFCDSSEHVTWREQATPDEVGQHLISITCVNCGIQTLPQNCFVSEPGTFYSAAYDAIEIWNGKSP